MNLKNNYLNLVNLSFYFLPFSLLIGSLAINLNILIFIVITSFYLIQNKIYVKFNLTNKILLSFFILVILSSIINFELIGIENVIKSFLLLKFFFIYIYIETLIANKKINLEIFFKICLALVLFVSLDLILQFFSGKNIFGFTPHEGRITGIFGSEAIAGAFIQKFFIFSLIGVILIKYLRKLRIKIYEILFFLISVSGIFVASNRMSFLIIIAVIFFIFLFYSYFRKELFFCFIILIPSILYLYQSNDKLNVKYEDLKSKIVRSIDVINEDEKNNKFYSANHGRIYYSVLKSFKEDMVVGGGLKSFRYKCSNLKEDAIVICSTHPHNYHLEVLHDTGIIGFILLSFFVILILLEKIRLLKNKSLDYKDKIIFSLLILNFLIEVFPIKSTGSLFSTWTGTMLWISIAMVNYDKKLKVNFNEK